MSEMSRPPEVSETTDDVADNGHLTIRIPNQRAHITMQSQWTSQRGKARCDHCRANNLKCDRILPMCNYCVWAKQPECTYAPTPNTSHRGIPRCGRCREHNLKCDRDIPSCSYCKEIGEASSCFYPSKLRPKPLDLQTSSSTSMDNDLRKWSQVPPDMKVYTSDDQPRASYYRDGLSGAGSKSTVADLDSDPESSHRGRFTAEYAQRRTGASSNYSAYNATPSGSDVEYISHPSDPHPQIQIKSKHIQIWTQANFMRLPGFVLKALLDLDPVEMPKRQEYETALDAFINSTMPAIRDTLLFPVSKYVRLAMSLTGGDMSGISDRIRTWARVHRLSSGSSKDFIILVPRDSVFSMPPSLAEADRQQFMQDLMRGDPKPDQLQVHHYDILPVRSQVYDILTYAHRFHYPSSLMLLEVVRLRFAYITWPMAEIYVRMCPLCSIRTRQAGENPHYSEEEQSDPGSSAPTLTPPP